MKTLAEKVADAAHLHKQFPVSSGNQHRVKELEWVPVEKPKSPTLLAKHKRAIVTTKEEQKAKASCLSPSSLPALPPPPAQHTFSPLPTIATPPVFQVEEGRDCWPLSSAAPLVAVVEPQAAKPLVGGHLSLCHL